MTSRLAVTREQATALFADSPGRMLDVTLRLPERPTMPCFDQARVSYDGPGSVPIPEGTRVEVGWWEPTAAVGGARSRAWDPVGYWHPVAFATLTEVHAALADGQPYRWYVTLSDIKPVEADQ